MFRNWASSDSVTRYLTWPTHSSVDITKKLMAGWIAQYQDPAYYHWGIELKSAGEVVGDISIVHMDEQIAEAELGWCLSDAFWGKGIMPEAATAVRDYLFDQVGFNRISARFDMNNPKSGRVMQKIGMQFEGVKRSAGINNQGLCDMGQYAILRSDLK